MIREVGEKSIPGSRHSKRHAEVGKHGEPCLAEAWGTWKTSWAVLLKR